MRHETTRSPGTTRKIGSIAQIVLIEAILRGSGLSLGHTEQQQASTPAPSKAEAKLQEIVTVLKTKDDLELQTLAKEADVLNNKTATSKLHKAVAKHGDAKTSLLEATRVVEAVS